MVSPAFLAAGLCCGAFIRLGWLGEKGSLDSNTTDSHSSYQAFSCECFFICSMLLGLFP